MDRGCGGWRTLSSQGVEGISEIVTIVKVPTGAPLQRKHGHSLGYAGMENGGRMRMLAVVVAFAAMSSAWAEDKNGQYGILTDTCGEYAKDRAKNRTLRYTSWLAGYVTSYNPMSP